MTPAERGDPPSFDPGPILRSLRIARVELLVVGGSAALGYGAHRATQDLDILPRPTSGNLGRLAEVLSELNARLRLHDVDDATARRLPLDVGRQLQGAAVGATTTLMTDHGALDVLTSLEFPEGVHHRYADLRPHAREIPVADGGVMLAADLEAIIAAKEKADRPKDHEALPELRRLARDLPQVDPSLRRTRSGRHPGEPTDRGPDLP